MFAGKSEELLRKLKRLEYADVNYLVFKPKIDVRFEEEVRSRDGRKSSSIVFDQPIEILNYITKVEKIPHVIAIDEAQFADESLAEVCELLAQLGFIVYVSALDKNFKNEPFLTTAKLLCYADVVNKLSAICTECGANGTITQKIVNNKPPSYNSPTIEIGNYETYTVRCRFHHRIYNKPIDPNMKEARNKIKTRLNEKIT